MKRYDIRMNNYSNYEIFDNSTGYVVQDGFESKDNARVYLKPECWEEECQNADDLIYDDSLLANVYDSEVS